MFKWFRKRGLNATREELHGIMVTLLVEGQQSLFIMLGADGSINRLGSGELGNRDRDMYIGLTDPALFQSLGKQITPELLAWCGQSRADPHPQGKACELTVGFKRANGEEQMMEWRYGSESMGPPPEVAQFVIAAVRATDGWHTSQKQSRSL